MTTIILQLQKYKFQVTAVPETKRHGNRIMDLEIHGVP